MKRKRRRGAKRSFAHLKKYWFRKKGRKRMAKKRKSRSRRRSSSGGGRRRATHRSSRRRSGLGGLGGGGRGIAAVKQDVPQLLMAAAYGAVEGKAAADSNFILNKLPKPITALGYTGNVAAAMYLATFVSPNKYLRMGARVVATIATYKLGRLGSLATSATTVSGGGDDVSGDGDEMVIDQNLMGALEAEGREGPSRTSVEDGVRYDETVRDAGRRV